MIVNLILSGRAFFILFEEITCQFITRIEEISPAFGKLYLDGYVSTPMRDEHSYYGMKYYIAKLQRNKFPSLPLIYIPIRVCLLEEGEFICSKLSAQMPRNGVPV